MQKFTTDYLNLMQILFQMKQRTNEWTKDKMDFDLFMFLFFFAFINTIILLFRRPCYYHSPSQWDSRGRKENARKKEKCQKSSVSASILIALKSYLTVQLPRIHPMCIKIVQMLDVEFISKENWNTVSFEQISKKRSKKTKTHFHFFCFLVFSSHNINFMFFRLFTKSTQCTYLRRDIGSRKKRKKNKKICSSWNVQRRYQK